MPSPYTQEHEAVFTALVAAQEEHGGEGVHLDEAVRTEAVDAVGGATSVRDKRNEKGNCQWTSSHETTQTRKRNSASSCGR